eukprot:5586852-Prorocentrum_lima.AAC.1
MTAHPNEGTEAWRKLVARYEPRTKQRAANMMVPLLNVDLTGELGDKTLTWGRSILTYEEQTPKVSTDDLRI